MPLTAGIVGLPNVGKSTLFNAITSSKVEAANYPFATINPNTGTVEVKDERLDVLTKMFNSQKTIPTIFEFKDIAGLVKGASKGEGLGNQFLSNIREVDAICHVVRCFKDNDVLHVEGSVDAIRDAEIINLELIMADLDSITNRIDRIAKKAQTKDKVAEEEYKALMPIKEALEQGRPARSVPCNDITYPYIKNMFLLTSKPVIYVANMGEEDLMDLNSNENYQKLAKLAEKENAKIVPICAKLEEELSELSKEEKNEFLQELGLSCSGLDNLIKTSYETLGLQTFFTAGEKESRAWTFRKGMKAPECAGIIHTDFEKGFIKAEVYSFQDLVECGSESALKEKGKLRIEGKEYIFQDGDVTHFRFNV